MASLRVNLRLLASNLIAKLYSRVKLYFEIMHTNPPTKFLPVRVHLLQSMVVPLYSDLYENGSRQGTNTEHVKML